MASNSSAEVTSAWLAAIQQYNLDTKTSLKLDQQNTSKNVLIWVKNQGQSFKLFREKGSRIRECLDPVLNFVDTFADTVGEAASIAFPPSKVICTGIITLLKAAKNQSAHYDAIIELFDRFREFLAVMDIYLKGKPITQIRDLVVKTLAQFLTMIGLVTRQIKDGRVLGYVKGLMGRNGEFKDGLHHLEQLARQEARVVPAATLDVGIEILGKLEKLESDTRDEEKAQLAAILAKVNMLDENIGTMGQGASEQKNKDLWRDIKLWLSAPSPSSNYNHALKERHKGTGKWVLKHDAVEGWMETPGALCWIYGGPGNGKTVLCTSIIEHLKTAHERIGYFYFDFREGAKQSYHKLLSSLVLQLADYTGSSAPAPALVELYEESKANSESATSDQLQETLYKLCADAPSGYTYIVLDALDECPDADRKQVLDLIEDIVNYQQDLDIRLLIVSRPELEIQDITLDLATHKLNLQIDQTGINSDIQEYIRHTIGTDRRLRKLETVDRQRVEERLVGDEQSMFRWVFCQLDALRKCIDVEKLNEALLLLPKTLADTYQRTLEEIDPTYQQRIYQVLAWVTLAKRPLTLLEVSSIFSIEHPQLRTVPNRIPKNPEDILTLCSGLLTTFEISDPYTQHELSGIGVSLGHFTVRDFLKENGHKYRFQDYSLQDADSRRFIDDSSLAVLTKWMTSHVDNSADDLLEHIEVGKLAMLFTLTCSHD